MLSALPGTGNEGLDPMNVFDPLWRRFVQGPATLGPTPGARQKWHRGRPRYAVWALRLCDPALEARVAAAQAALAGAIRPLAPSQLHVTLWVAGFPRASPVLDDDVALDALRAQHSALEAFAGAPVRITVGGANSFLSAAFLEVQDPHADIARVRAQLDRHATEIRFEPHVPHVTLGTYRGALRTAELCPRLSALRTLPQLPLAARPELLWFDATQQDAELLPLTPG